MTSIVWFRQDLRLSDNPAFTHAASQGPVIGLYVLDETTPSAGRRHGGASKWWLHHSLGRLQKSLDGLVLLRGDPKDIVPEFARRTGASGIYWNRRYEPFAIACDTEIKARLMDAGFDAKSFNGSLLFEPWEIRTQSGGPFKVFSAFWRACLRNSVAAALPAPEFQSGNSQGIGERLSDLGLLPNNPNWAQGFEPVWEPGETGARKRADEFLSAGLSGYSALRDRPDRENVSRLSPHLHFGEISPRQLWAAAGHASLQNPGLRKDADKFLSEIGWREFSYHLLYHFPDLPVENLNPAFNAFPWVSNADHLEAWQKGQTGYPLVDAGMRELWATGYMHNRVRMVAASFLVKHLRIDWRQGEEWFWDTLVDADLANNTASWQWVAGSGADAAPYFRIFNPTLQGQKFDPDGNYVRRWCPELASLPAKFIHEPSDAPADILSAAGVVPGRDYPLPIVEHRRARDAALEGYKAVKDASRS